MTASAEVGMGVLVVSTPTSGTPDIPFWDFAPPGGGVMAQFVAPGALDQGWFVEPLLDAYFLAKQTMFAIQQFGCGGAIWV